jgi:flagellar hook protein FlgE
MVSSFYNGISGAKTYQFGIDSWSNNIANINTTGYKGDTPEFKTNFSTTLAQSFHSTVTSNIGNGSTVSSNALIKSNGELGMSDDEFDLGITADGYFVVGTSSPTELKDAFFSRNGDFHRDADGYLVNNQGHYLYGIDLGKIDDNGIFNSDDTADEQLTSIDGALTPLRIPDKIFYRPNLTTEASLKLNLNATQYLKAVNDVFVDAEGNLDEATLKSQDMNAIGAQISGHPSPFNLNTESIITVNSSETNVEYATNPPEEWGETITTVGDVTTTVTKTGGSTTTKVTTTTNLQYGTDFKTVGEFMDAFSTATGTTTFIEDPNTNNDCRIHFLYEDEVEKNIAIETNVSGLLDHLGFPANIDMTKNTDLVSQTLYVPTYTTTTEIYDELGAKHIIFAEYYMQTRDDLTVDDDTEVWNFKAGIYDKTGENLISNELQEGSIIFDSNTFQARVGDPVELSFFGNTVKFDPYGLSEEDGVTVATTQNSRYLDSAINKTTADGNEEGYAQEMTIDSNGIIHFNFSNYHYETYGRIGLVSFINDQGLRKIDSTTFETVESINLDGETSISSGAPRLMWEWSGENGENVGRAALAGTSIAQYRLETSNILMATALTELMISQRAYSANAKAITTSDELLKEAISLKK